jgi:N-acetylglucosaminyldiphosphoundecaprenol N-acetyl-beta-D-mannosaminyltransferase
MMSDQLLSSRYMLGTRVNRTSYSETLDLVSEWANHRESRYVCVASVNNIMEAYDSIEFREIMNGSDLTTSDGMPLVWGLKLLGCVDATRVYGPDLTVYLLERAAAVGLPVGLYGGTPQVLKKLVMEIKGRFPKLRVNYAWSPPFRQLTPQEDQSVVDAINRSGTRVLFIGLNTPKQDYWMAAHRDRVKTVMVGVGAAFDFIAGAKPQAPRWIMRIGMEWSFRLLTEPRRLWKRYLRQNPRFLALFTLQLLGLKKFTSDCTIE